MSGRRWLIALGSALVLAALVLWQAVRQAEMDRCREAGGLWDGPATRCLPGAGRPIIQRDIQRS